MSRITLFPSAALTVTTNGNDTATTNIDTGLVVYLDITASSGTSPTLDVKLQALDAVSGQYFDIPGASFAQKTTTGTDMLQVGPGLTESANAKVSAIIPDNIRAVATIGGTTPSFTFSLIADA